MSKLQFVVVKIMNLMEEGGSETLKHFVSEIFVELEQWGLRGDPLLWKYLKNEGVDKLMTSRHLCAIRLHERKTAMP